MRDQGSFLQGPGQGQGREGARGRARRGRGVQGRWGDQRGDMGGRVSAGARGGTDGRGSGGSSERLRGRGWSAGVGGSSSWRQAGGWGHGGGRRGLWWPKWGGGGAQAAPTGSAVAGPTSGGEGWGGQRQHRGSPEGSAVSSRWPKRPRVGRLGTRPRRTLGRGRNGLRAPSCSAPTSAPLRALEGLGPQVPWRPSLPTGDSSDSEENKRLPPECPSSFPAVRFRRNPARPSPPAVAWRSKGV